MAGYREFVTGEVLTAANVNDYLAKQAVMKFADAAARNTALGTAVGGANALREGMVAYLDDTNELQTFDGTAWGAIGAAGIGSNVVQTVKTDTYTTTANTFQDITGLTATITPTSATSLVLVMYSGTWGGTASGGANMRLVRGATDIFLGDAAGSRTRASNSTFPGSTAGVSPHGAFAGIFVDNPATTSPVTYKLQLRNTVSGQTAAINRDAGDGDVATTARTASSITLIEVAA